MLSRTVFQCRYLRNAGIVSCPESIDMLIRQVRRRRHRHTIASDVIAVVAVRPKLSDSCCRFSV
jgi:hypothetical protein